MVGGIKTVSIRDNTTAIGKVTLKGDDTSETKLYVKVK